MNCKPGDLAIVIQAVREENIGKICHVKSYAGVEKIFPLGLVTDVFCVEFGLPIVSSKGTLETVVFCPVAWLRPVSGLPDTEDTDTEQPIKELA